MSKLGLGLIASNPIHKIFDVPSVFGDALIINRIPGPIAVLVVSELRWDGVAFVSFTFHLVDIPIGGEKTCVDDSDIGSVFFNFLHVPNGKSIIVPNSE